MTDSEMVKAAAKHVMHWHYREDPKLAHCWFIPFFQGDREQMEFCGTATPEWNPLISDDDTWEMLDYFPDDWSIDVHRMNEGIWAVRVYDLQANTPQNRRYVRHADRRRAIMLACLRAVGVEV